MSSPETKFQFPCSSSSSLVRELKNLQLDSKFQERLKEIAIRYIGSDLVKSLQAIKRSEFISARNRIDVPHGLFGLNLDSFYNRRMENTVYIDVLQLVCKNTLQQAKICIVLDDLQDFVRDLFSRQQNMDIGRVLRDIKNSKKLLTINDTIASDFRKNLESLKKLQDKLNAFNVRETNAILYVNNQVYGVQNNCVEAELIGDPIEYRYKMSFHHRTMEQYEEKSRQIEDNLQMSLNETEALRHREYIVSDCVQIKQRVDIDILKSRLQEMTEQYDREYEILDGQILYKTNAIEAMRDQFNDCLVKLEFYKTDFGRLKEWQTMWEQKKLQDAEDALKDLKPKKKKTVKKNKEKE